jgi:branched-chain amino acid transport system substrate-binding protein
MHFIIIIWTNNLSNIFVFYVANKRKIQKTVFFYTPYCPADTIDTHLSLNKLTMNKKTGLIIKSILAIVITIAIFIVIKGNNSNSIKLGLMLPLTGDYAAAGQNMQKGMTVALEQYKKDHPNVRITTVIEDDAYDATKGVTAYKKLADLDKVDAILMLSTPVIDAIHEDVVKRGIPIIQLGVQTVGVGDDNIIQFSPAADAPIGFLAKYLANSSGFYSKKVAVIYDNSAAQLSFYKIFEQNYTHEFTPLIVNGKDVFRSYATKIANEGYGAVVVIESPQNGALFTKELLTVDKTLPTIAYDAQLQTGFADYGRILGDTNKINGAISMWFKSGKMDELTKLYQIKYGEAPGFLTDFSYDMINTTLATYDKDQAKWVSNLKKYQDPNGASGSISFDNYGVRLQPMVITRVQDGKLVPVEDVKL